MRKGIQLYILYENATGYALFQAREFEEIGSFLPDVQKSIRNSAKFKSIVNLVTFYPFKTIQEALENMNCVIKGQLHLDLQIFLENNVPKSQESQQAVVLGVQDAALASAITETLSISCSTSGVVLEALRGIRFHFHRFIKGYKDSNAINQSQLSLSHQYARAKLSINCHKFDKVISETIQTVDDLDKDINMLCSRIKRLYSIHFPELAEIVRDSEQYIMCVEEIKDRKNLSENTLEALQTLLKDSDVAHRILKAAKNSMGMDIAEADQKNIKMLIDLEFSVIKRRKEMNDYVKNKTKHVAPNLVELLGEEDTARLISQAGSLANLAKFPASTVQILGAQKSLFRALKTKGQTTSNFGCIKQSALIGKSVKGRRARYLANKCTLASKIDCFSVIPMNKSKHLNELIEQQMKLYEKEDPEKMEKKKAIIAAKKALLRKKMKERRRQNMLKS
ncbi:nucleolar protein 56 [Nephila pilipes]|uniref:Nucleolar protein 56 n=1 Tax=Nephila pilipes TaxID=299642 RepID=A0A8X6THZ4_NEPPI|nr:nucleolar protein 56 [Nephila pilipes]